MNKINLKYNKINLLNILEELDTIYQKLKNKNKKKIMMNKMMNKLIKNQKIMNKMIKNQKIILLKTLKLKIILQILERKKRYSE